MLVLTTALISSVDALAQSAPSRLQGPPTLELQQTQVSGEDLEREIFRRQAAEAAQKQLERLAENLRERLAAEVAARTSAEEKLADLTARIVVSDQIDQERQRMHSGQLATLEGERTALERKVSDLTQQLTEESRRRRELEVERDEASRDPPAAAIESAKTIEKLGARAKELERQLTAAEWARKLAEAQLKLIGERQNNR
jgi:hypothetical protein